MSGAGLSKTDSRYPYTYAADYLRINIAGHGDKLISRAEAAAAQRLIAEAIGVNKVLISESLADKFIEQENAK
jgi:hypothetical protein